MWRIILMVLYSLPFVPYWWYQLCSYAKHTDEIPEDKKYALLQTVTVHANKGGRVKIDVHGRENIPREESFVFFPNQQGLFEDVYKRQAIPIRRRIRRQSRGLRT